MHETEPRIPRQRPPIVLIIDDQEWTLRSLESILAPNGFAVMRAYTGARGFERAIAHAPDAIFIDANLPDMAGAELCQRLRDDARIGSGVPIIVSSAERPSRRQRLEALRSGAWDVLTAPFDSTELMLRLDTYVKAKFATDAAREGGLVDHATGFYNVQGLERRAQELKSWAYRERDAMACIVLAPTPELDDNPLNGSELMPKLAKAIRRTARVSDILGRLGKREFVIVAPSTNAAGAVTLANRLNRAICEDTQKPPGAAPVLMGYDAVPDVREAPGEAAELLLRAGLAFRRSNGSEWLRAYKDA